MVRRFFATLVTISYGAGRPIRAVANPARAIGVEDKWQIGQVAAGIVTNVAVVALSRPRM